MVRCDTSAQNGGFTTMGGSGSGGSGDDGILAFLRGQFAAFREWVFSNGERLETLSALGGILAGVVVITRFMRGD